MLLRSEERAAVARVHRRLARLADRYRDAARLAQLRRWRALAGMLHGLAAERAAMRRRAAGLIEALGGTAREILPRPARAVQREIGPRLRATVRRVRALLGAGHPPDLVRRLERAEDALAAAIAAALALDLPDRVASPLGRMRAAMDRARRQLAETRIAIASASRAS